MSNRSFFDYRYTVPGFVFLLIVFLVNFDEIAPLIQSQNLAYSTILGVVTAFSGSTLGFVISQMRARIGLDPGQ